MQIRPETTSEREHKSIYTKETNKREGLTPQSPGTSAVRGPLGNADVPTCVIYPFGPCGLLANLVWPKRGQRKSHPMVYFEWTFLIPINKPDSDTATATTLSNYRNIRYTKTKI